MPAAKKSNSTASKVATSTFRPRARPSTKKIVKSSEFIDDEADEVSDDGKKSAPNASTNLCHPRGRPSTKKITGSSESVECEADDVIEISDEDKKSALAAAKASTNTPQPRGRSATKKVLRSSGSVDNGVEKFIDVSDDEDTKSVKSSASMASRSRSRLSTKVAKNEDDVDISAYDSDGAMSIKSTKSTKSAMSVDDSNFVTTPTRSRSFVPKTPSSCASSRKRSASAMTSPITDDEDFEMLESPVKHMAPMQRVRFDNAAKSVTPLKGVLKKPEVVLPL
ncbi:hypothetical protein PILCRDRAFT_10289 [Piloderma croceum F 1598]|uniref:Uncharacterized protein n=1 Tax=Piloderma croceum (strain F 1598) TaxID=765440 RepID=A0A0C3FIC9_PILCF|nr:hypothetical protein PILCRDRAFT_10289 [Piloderma croceum F 1598]